MKLKGKIKLKNVCRQVAEKLTGNISQGICSATGSKSCSIDTIGDLDSTDSSSEVQCDMPDIEGEAGEFRRRLASSSGAVVS